MRSHAALARWFLVVALVAGAGFTSPPARAFEVHRHFAMTYQVLHRHGVGAFAAGLIAWGAMLPDIQDCIPGCYCDFAPDFCQPDSAGAVPYAVDHFDNNLLDESIYRINARMQEAMAGMVATPFGARASAKALVAFGRALHTTQDFYAHSTFLEINIFTLSSSVDPQGLPLWQGEPYALYSWHHGPNSGNGSLQTGYYLQGAPAGGYTHGQLNKDSPGSTEGSQPINIIGYGASNLYGAASGDLDGSMSFTDDGLAPQHTLYAYQKLFSDGLVFPYVFSAAAGAVPARAASSERTQQILDFFAWCEQDPTIQSLANAANTVMEHTWGDSLATFDPNQIDADGLPVPPAPAGVTSDEFAGARLLSEPRPNPFTHTVQLELVAPRAGHVRVAVFDTEGRRLATLLSSDVGAGRHPLAWDGRLESGAQAPAGIYLVRLSAFGHEESRRVVLTR